METDRISQLFKDRTLLITGGSGFIGKTLIEKLIRSCPELKTIYLLVRTKKGKNPTDRLDDIFSNPLFDSVKESRGKSILHDICKVISGDVTQINLGISKEDKEKIINEVSIIYHCAATVRFDEDLKTAVLLNTRGTQFMVDLAKECKVLDLFCHVSTAYCHLNEKLLLEKPYPPLADPHKIIKAIELMDSEVIESLTHKILGTCPNTYTFTKGMSEAIVVESMKEIPTLILRPSIVIPIYQEPIAGWTDNINGPAGLLIGAGKGVIRTMYCNSDSYGDYLPVDLGVNGMLIAAWNYIANKDYDRQIINMVSSAEMKVSWNEIIDIGRKSVATKIPLNGVLWYPGGTMKRNRFVHQIEMVLYHWIPAYVLDALLYCLGYPPVLCRVQRRVVKGMEVFEYYANNQWDFDNSSVLYIRTLLNKTEKIKYKIDTDGVDKIKYFENCIVAARKYILKESDESIPAARRHMKIMWWADQICKKLFIALLIYYVGSYLFSMFFS